MTTTAGALKQAQHLTFSMAGEEFGIDILRVKEIIEYIAPTVVPMTPPSVRGVINVRGSVVPVVDLAVRFGQPAGEITKRTCIIIVEMELDGEQIVMGVVGDTVNEVTPLSAEEIESAPNFGTNVDVEFLHGIGKVGEHFVLILDVDRVLSADEFAAVAAARENGEGLADDASQEELEAGVS